MKRLSPLVLISKQKENMLFGTPVIYLKKSLVVSLVQVLVLVTYFLMNSTRFCSQLGEENNKSESGNTMFHYQIIYSSFQTTVVMLLQKVFLSCLNNVLILKVTKLIDLYALITKVWLNTYHLDCLIEQVSFKMIFILSSRAQLHPQIIQNGPPV